MRTQERLCILNMCVEEKGQSEVLFMRWKKTTTFKCMY